jgi:hypothetical protein
MQFFFSLLFSLGPVHSPFLSPSLFSSLRPKPSRPFFLPSLFPAQPNRPSRPAPPPAQPARAPFSSSCARLQAGPACRGLPRHRARAGLGLTFSPAAARPPQPRDAQACMPRHPRPPYETAAPCPRTHISCNHHLLTLATQAAPPPFAAKFGHAAVAPLRHHTIAPARSRSSAWRWASSPALFPSVSGILARAMLRQSSAPARCRCPPSLAPGASS